MARNAQKEFFIGQIQGHTRHIASHLWMASSFNDLRAFLCSLIQKSGLY